MHPDAPVSRRINAERVLLLSWPRAILLQLAHPLIAAGVADHSTFRDGPMASVRRLHQTVHAMLSLVFGSAEQQEQTIAAIQAIHRRVHGTLRTATGPFAAGTPYSAEDPDLLLWVHATLLDSAVLAYEGLVGPIDKPDRDAYCGETSRIAMMLGARRSDIPLTWQDLESYLARMYGSGVLVVGVDAHALAPTVMAGHFPGLMRPASWAVATLTASWLPPTIRVQYGLDPDTRRARALRAAVRMARRCLPRAAVAFKEDRISPS